ncbi:MAG: DUF2160 family membrane protein [Halobacteriales archaeon]
MSGHDRPGFLGRILPFDLALGDRIFLGVATFIFIHLVWLRFMSMRTLPATVIGLAVLIAIVRWG